ncbi:sodium-dependent dicarboxylate transporter SdcS [Kroppenstedtia guangzhouensis]|uniref:Sodium-dependent dicarboxylate transporter SdcS n=1 Tax=Kroppenstedtia guangzhouensis TaxID=1274356 RepID=A0ABQ1FZZ7_9BACL|nr:DASS family sodium-coupled anion symporter [Kroppenstedtia guangzhouensis]GGA34760.1 sodium-dependent dicarboxylate transporter SdcS [Kroppenstedtia guangzhouensis]
MKALQLWWNHLWVWNDDVKRLFRMTVGVRTASSSSPGGETKRLASTPGPSRPYNRRQLIGLILGPLLFIITFLFIHPEGMSSQAQAVLASTLWIAVWWITEAIPIPATSLLPIILFPLTGALEAGPTTSAYGDPNIFLFMGGFMIALTMERWNLHRRIALTIISWVGTQPQRLVLGSMVATGFLSMWISNTATAMMMVPIGMAVINHVGESFKKSDPLVDTTKGNFPFGTAMMLGIAYAASIGGLGTLIGTPPNAIFAAQVKQIFDVEISFATWMLFGVPVVIVLLFFTWWYLVKVAYPMKYDEIPGGGAIISQEKKSLGAPSAEEKAVFVVFILTALAWIFRDLILKKFIPGIDDTVIAISAALVLFLIPSRNHPGEFLLNWDTAKNLPWGVLLLFGGGLAIAAGIVGSELDKWIGLQLIQLDGMNFLLILVVVIALVIFLTEITSNTATATMMYPIMASFAAALSVHPYGLMVAAGLAASCAFMLPVATPPNAVVFGSGWVRIEQMAKAGFWLNLISIAVITVAVYFLLPMVWRIDLMTPMT